MEKPVILGKADIEKIEKTLSRGFRVEIIPIRDGVRILRVRLDEAR